MIQPSSHRLLLGSLALAAATASGVAYLSVGRCLECTVPTPEREIERVLPAGGSLRHALTVEELEVNAGTEGHSTSDGAAPPAASDSPRPAAAASPRPAAPALRMAQGGAGRARASQDGESLLVALPQPLLELARATTWNEHISAALERFMAESFDVDGNGLLDDFERIVAVRALRDAAWPPAPVDAAELVEPGSDAIDGAGTAALSVRDRRLHHAVDEARRRDREEYGGSGEVSDDLRTAITQRFLIDDDGRLSVVELARFMTQHNLGSEAADLNGDGRADDSDLRLFLEVASPIDRS